MFISSTGSHDFLFTWFSFTAYVSRQELNFLQTWQRHCSLQLAYLRQSCHELRSVELNRRIKGSRKTTGKGNRTERVVRNSVGWSDGYSPTCALPPQPWRANTNYVGSKCWTGARQVLLSSKASVTCFICWTKLAEIAYISSNRNEVQQPYFIIICHCILSNTSRINSN
jgi:hypothetical protein